MTSSPIHDAQSCARFYAKTHRMKEEKRRTMTRKDENIILEDVYPPKFPGKKYLSSWRS